jgi:cytoskeletal protein CcmA (bactofilin family)
MAHTTDGDLRAPPRSQKAASLIAHDMTLEGNITGGGELQVDGAIKGDVRVERVTIGEGGHVDGGVYAEAVEVRGRVNGSITAKQVRLHGACHVDGDITHEQLAMEPGAFFQGRSLRLQRPATQGAQPTVTPPLRPAPASPSPAAGAPPKDSAALDLGPKPSSPTP